VIALSSFYPYRDEGLSAIHRGDNWYLDWGWLQWQGCQNMKS